MGLKTLFDDWMHHAGTQYADKQWLLSKWEVCEGIEWPPEKIDLMARSIVEGLGLTRSDLLTDLGCGGAWISKLLTPYAGKVVGLDFCTDMLTNARIYYPEASLVQGAIGQLPFKSGSVDKGLSYFVFLNFMDDVFVEQALSDIYRVLKKGGRALIGQLPDKTCSADYDRAKGAYLDHCARHYKIGRSNREVHRAPQKLFDVPALLGYLDRQGIAHEERPSFNPFYRPGEPPTVDWRFDLVLKK